MEKNTGKVREKSGNFVSAEKWEPWRLDRVGLYKDLKSPRHTNSAMISQHWTRQPGIIRSNLTKGNFFAAGKNL